MSAEMTTDLFDDAVSASDEEANAPVLSLNDILTAADIETREVYVPQWRGKVIVQGISRAEFHDVRRRATDKKGNVDLEKVELLLISAGVKEPKFDLLSLNALKSKNMGAIQVVMNAINELSATTPEERAAAADAFR